MSDAMQSFFDPPQFGKTDRVRDFERTRLYQDWVYRTGGGDANDYLIVLTPSSKTAGSGSGKTTCATSLAKAFDRSDEGFNAEEKASLDAGELAYKILPSIETGSAVIFDEAQGAPGTKSVNARRGMTQEALDAITAILANRDKRLTIIIVAQQLGMLDNLIYPMIDAWLLITKDPQMPRGPELVHHKLTMNDYDLNNPDIRTPAIESLTWPRIDHDDPDYRTMEQKKQDAKQRRASADEDATPITELPKPLRDQKIRKMAKLGIRQEDIASTFDLSQPQISTIINDQ